MSPFLNYEISWLNLRWRLASLWVSSAVDYQSGQSTPAAHVDPVVAVDAYGVRASRVLRVHPMACHYPAADGHCCTADASRCGVRHCPAVYCYRATDHYRWGVDHRDGCYHERVEPSAGALHHFAAVRLPDGCFVDGCHHADGHFV